jgi:hypothetical protein
MVYATRGLGKTWLAASISTILTRMTKISDLPKLNHWEVRNKCGVLHVDGEMNAFELQERFKLLRNALGKDSKKYPLYILSVPDGHPKYPTCGHPKIPQLVRSNFQ